MNERWNSNVLIASGVVLGAILAATLIAMFQAKERSLDLHTLGEFATFLVAPLTLGLVAATLVLARETREMWRQNRLPHVLVTIEPDPVRKYWMELVVENIGPGIAFDLQASLDPDIQRKGQFALKASECSLLHLAVLKPGQRFSTFIGEWNNLSPPRSVARCVCKDMNGAARTFSNLIDLSAYSTMLSHGPAALEEIANELEKIRKLLAGRLEVNTHDGSARAQEDADQKAAIREFTERAHQFGRVPARG